MKNKIWFYLLPIILFALWSGCDAKPSAQEPSTQERHTERTKNAEIAEKDAGIPQDNQLAIEKQQNTSIEKFFQETAGKETADKEVISKETTSKEVISKETTGKEENHKTCTFNKDCPTQERCECDEKTGCFCLKGVRGTGKNGVDTCKSGNDCKTALCIEGNGGVFYCSSTCKNDEECEPGLPICLNVSFVGKVCVRKKN